MPNSNPANRKRGEQSSEKSAVQRPEEQRSVLELIAESYSGLIPHPQIIEAYERVSPGSAKLIIETFVGQVQHRHEIEKEAVTGQEKRANRGQIFAFVLAISALGIGAFAVYKDAFGTASIFGATTAVSLALAFLGGKREIVNELKRKASSIVQMRKRSGVDADHS